MILFRSQFEMPSYEEKFLDHYKKSYAADLGVKMLDIFDYIKVSGEHMDIKEFENKMAKYPMPEVDRVKYSMEFFAIDRQKYNEFKAEILSLFTRMDGANKQTMIYLHDTFNKFESQ